MTQQEALIRLANIIETGYKHPFYSENVELYEKYLTLSTGRGWERFLKQLTSRVTDEDFEEIINVTIDICKSVVKNLTHVFYRVTRSSGIKIEYVAAKPDDFKNILSTFGKFGFEGYMEKRFTDFCKIDPNGWIVIDFKSIDGSDYARPYPVEFYSPDVIDYEYDLNILEYLCVKQDESKSVGESDVMTQDYTIYTKDGAVKFISRPELKSATPFDLNKTDYKTGDLIGLNEHEEEYEENGFKKKETVYDVYELFIPDPYNLKQVPAINVGYLTDELTRGETFVNFFDNAVPFLEKIIKANSESDISMSKHAFPQKIQFTPPCPAGCERDEHGVFCIDGETCPTCEGHGHLAFHRTGMDYIFIPLTPENAELIDPDKMVRYVSIPLETIKYQWDHIINDLVAMAKRTIYNTDIFSQQQIQDTATSKLIEMENMYDTLYIYGVHYAGCYAKLLEIISDITTIDTVVSVNVSKDLKLFGKAELLQMLSLANTAGAPSSVIEAINDEIVYSFYGNTSAYKNYLERKKLLPFQNKSKEQVMLILNSLPSTHKLRMMYQFGEEIIGMLESRYPQWASFTEEKKKQLIDAELKIIEDEMKAEKETVETPNFGS